MKKIYLKTYDKQCCTYSTQIIQSLEIEGMYNYPIRQYKYISIDLKGGTVLIRVHTLT